MSSPSTNRIRTGYLIALLVLIISFGFLFYFIRNVSQQSRALANSSQVINILGSISAGVTDVQSGITGHQLNGTANSIRSYEVAARDTRVLLQELKDVTSAQSPIYSSIDSLSTSLTGQLTNVYAAMQSRGDIWASVAELKGTGLQLRQFSAREFASMDRHSRQLDRSLTAAYVFAIVLLLAGAVTVIYALIVRSTGKVEGQVRASSPAPDTDTSSQDELNAIDKFASTGRIARTLAHEVRNPLTNISLASEQIKEIVPENSEADLLLQMIGRNVNRINQLVSDLLSSTRFGQLEYSSININQLLDETLLLADERIKMNGVQIQKNYEEGLCDIQVDGDKLKLAFLNIIVNAIEAMNKGEGVLTISTQRRADRCLIEFSDNGSGMDDETMSKAFEPYFTSKAKGNGLGLTNTQNIILNHKGSITVRSKMGSGSAFSVVLNFENVAEEV